MPTAQVKLDHGYKSLDWIVYLGNREEHLGMAHEAFGTKRSAYLPGTQVFFIIMYILRDPFQHTARFQDEGREDNATKVGAWSELGDDVHEHYTRC